MSQTRLRHSAGLGGRLGSNSLFSWSRYWAHSNLFLFFASDPTDILNKVVATQLPNQVTGATDYLTVTGSGLNARYRTPDNATYRTADSDYCFWKTYASESTCDGNRLIGYDFPRILVKYLNVSPYTILWIAILKPGVTVTDGMRDAFDLSIWWDNTLSFHGNTKQNKPLPQQYVWTAELIAPTGLTLTLISGGVKIDWTDNSGGLDQTEIWGQNDGAAYALLYTINAGTVTKNDICTPVDLRYYKIRGKNGIQYSPFTSPVSIAMLDVEKVNQTTWYTPAYWDTVFQANWSQSGNTLVSNGNSGSALKSAFFTAGLKYKIIVSITWVSGTWIRVWDGAVTGLEESSSGTKTEYITAIQAWFELLSSSFNGSITALSIKKVLFP